MTRWKNPEPAHCTRAVLFWHFAETLYRLMWHTECDRISEESRPVTHTNEPAVIALLHDADEISLLQLQLVVVLRHVAVQSLKSGAAWSREDTKCEISKGLSLPRILIRVKRETDLTHIPQFRRFGSGLLLCDWGCWEMMRDCLLGWGCSLWRESLWWWDRVLQYLTEVSAIFKISLHTAS